MIIKVAQYFLALVVIAAFLAIIVIWIFHPPTGEPGTLAVLNTLVGALGAAFGMVVSYFFGSSSGSQQKDETIGAMAAAPLPGGAGSVTVTAGSPGQAGTTVIKSDKEQDGKKPEAAKDKS